MTRYYIVEFEYLLKDSKFWIYKRESVKEESVNGAGFDSDGFIKLMLKYEPYEDIRIINVSETDKVNYYKYIKSVI